MANIKDAIDLHRQGRLGEAESKCHSILARDPRHFEALMILGLIRLQQRTPAEARQFLEQAVAIRPQSVEALSNLAFVLLILGLPIETLATCDRVLVLAPNHVGTLVTRGNALFRSNRLDEARASYNQALKIDDRNMEALIGQGAALARLGRIDESVATFERIPIGQNPANLHKRANLLQSLGLLGAAARDFQNLALFPSHALAGWVGLMTCAQESCDWAQVAQARQRVLAAVNAGQRVDPLLVLRISSDPAEHLKAARNAAPRIAAARLTRVPAVGRPARLRIAYVSPDFRIHPLAYLIPELLERHDRTRFEVIGVSLGPPDDSDVRGRIVRAFDGFHDMHARSDEDIVRLTRQLEIDVVIDLAGYTEHSRPGILARRVGSVQASYLGYCGTSGANFVDYLLVDRIVAPPEEQRFFTERLVYLPDSFMVGDSTQTISQATPSRRECGLPDDGFVFCCFNKNYKITQSMFDLWMRLLRSVEGSILWLSDNRGQGQEKLRNHAAAQGVDPQRLVFAPALPARVDHFARHRLANLFLDTHPYNAHTTASDALFAGLPVLTLMGPTFVGRVAASMLRAIGLGELVTETPEGYEALALDLARNPSRMQALRAKLVTNRSTWALFDTDRFRRNIERAYDQMFEIYRRGEMPQSFDVVGE